MSRCVLDDERRNTQVVIGWDPNMQTFFARVWERTLYDSDFSLGLPEPGVRLWTGCGDRTWVSGAELDLLITMIQLYACSHDPAELRRELLTDQENDDGERSYDLYDGSDGWLGDDLPEDWRPETVAQPVEMDAEGKPANA